MIKIKPIVKIEKQSQFGYAGEFIEPNIIMIYTENCKESNMNLINVVIHEYIHFLINKNKFNTYVFYKLNHRFIKKHKNDYKSEGDMMYFIPEERFCRFVARKFADLRVWDKN